MVTKFDHPDFVGGIVWSDCELRWINEKLTAAQAREAELAARVERLREVIGAWERSMDTDELLEAESGLIASMNATPEQSLARLRNQVLEEAAKVVESLPRYSADPEDVIRQLKEPE